MTELKPCPFCGSKAYFERWSSGKNESGAATYSFYIRCEKCGLYFPKTAFSVLVEITNELKVSADFSEAEKAIEAWNRRANNDRT